MLHLLGLDKLWDYTLDEELVISTVDTVCGEQTVIFSCDSTEATGEDWRVGAALLSKSNVC